MRAIDNHRYKKLRANQTERNAHNAQTRKDHPTTLAPSAGESVSGGVRRPGSWPMLRLMVSLLVAVVVGAAVTVPVRRNRRTSILLDAERDELLEKFAVSACRGNKSAAVSALVDLHAGRALDIVQALEPEPYRVEAWRPRRLSSSLVEDIAGIVRQGNLADTALKLEGVPPHQRRVWLRRGRSDRQAGKVSVYADLVAAIERAEAENEVERIAALEHENPKWLLERQHPDQYGERKRVDSTHTHQLLPMIDFDLLSVEETRTLVALLKKANPQADEIAGARSKPVLELLPGDVLEGDAVEVDEPDAPAEKPEP